MGQVELTLSLVPERTALAGGTSSPYGPAPLISSASGSVTKSIGERDYVAPNGERSSERSSRGTDGEACSLAPRIRI